MGRSKEKPKVQPRFQVEGFYGAVILKDWTAAVDGETFLLFIGTVSIIEDKAMLGFEVSDRETNWIARVDGATQSYNFAGCQVRGVVALDVPLTEISKNAYLVP